MLEQKLAAAERKAKNRWRITAGMWIATVTLGLVAMVLASSLLPVGVRPFGVTLMALACCLFYLSLLRLFMYLAFERRVPEQVRNESRDVVLMELSRKIDAIVQRLDAAEPGKAG